MTTQPDFLTRAHAYANELDDLPENRLGRISYVTVKDAISEAEKRGWTSFSYGRLWLYKTKTGEWKGNGNKQ